jgi:hypothetical protein
MALYRAQRWNQSQAENSEFYFGPLSLLLFGAASFVYELMPGGPDYSPDVATTTSFFVDEQIPANWTNRVTPYSNSDVTNQIVEMYLLHPVLFGGNTADGMFAPYEMFIIETDHATLFRYLRRPPKLRRHRGRQDPLHNLGDRDSLPPLPACHRISSLRSERCYYSNG